MVSAVTLDMYTDFLSLSLSLSLSRFLTHTQTHTVIEQARLAAQNHPKFVCLFLAILALIIFHYFTLWLPTLIFWFILIPGMRVCLSVCVQQQAGESARVLESERERERAREMETLRRRESQNVIYFGPHSGLHSQGLSSCVSS